MDTQRDELTLPLVRACLENDVPLLGICRGFQEINVALGGSLHQQVHSVPAMMNHCEGAHLSDSEKYAPAHAVRIVADTALAQWAGGCNAKVNSLHQQGIDRLADDLEPIAFAPDGLVEAVQVRGAKAFAYAVQWHPEWNCLEDLLQAHIFKAFGDACRHRQVQRLLRHAGQHQAGTL
jgi:putative glutamine amidotransferase